MLSNKGRHDTTKLGSNVVQDLKINQRRILIDSLEIGIPAPEQMIALGERQLANGVKVGQLLNSKTLNYKKFTPHRDGLFCERIFGPVQSFVCACGKKKESVQSKNRQKEIIKANLLPSLKETDGFEMKRDNILSSSQNKSLDTVDTELTFCPKCQVEYISKNVRRHRLGYIKLFAPVTHIWYLKGRPSYLSLFLGKRKKAMTSLAYCNAYLVEQIYPETGLQHFLKDTDKYASVLVRKKNVESWQSSDPNILSGKDDKIGLSNRFKNSLFSIKDVLDDDLHLSSKIDQRSLLDMRNVTTVNNNFVKQEIQSSRRITKKLKHKMSTKLGVANASVESTLVRLGSSEPTLDQKSECQDLRTLYTRAQALPVLPSLICHFQLRDSLISFLQSRPRKEDIPIPMYCQTPRRYPLRDVHKFLAESRSCKSKAFAANAQNQVEKLSSESVIRFIGHTNQSNSQKQIVNAGSVARKNEVVQKLGFCVALPKQSFGITLFLHATHALPKRSYAKTKFWHASTYLNRNHNQSLYEQGMVAKQVQEQSSLQKPNLWKGDSLKSTSTAQFVRNLRTVERGTKQDKTLSKLAVLPLELRFVASSNVIGNSLFRPFSSNQLTLERTKPMFLPDMPPRTSCFTNQLLYPEQSLTTFLTTKQLLAKESNISLRGVLLNAFVLTIRAGLIGLSFSFSRLNDTKQVVSHNKNKETVTFCAKSSLCQNLVLARQGMQGTEPKNEIGVANNQTSTRTRTQFESKCTKQFLFSLQENNCLQQKNRMYSSFALNTKDDRSNKKNNQKIDNVHVNVNKISLEFDPHLFQDLFYRTSKSEPKNKMFLQLYSFERESQSKPLFKRFTYLYIPILLYARELHFTKKEFGSTGLFCCLSLLRHQQCDTFDLHVPRKKNEGTPPRISTLDGDISSDSFFSLDQYNNVANIALQTLLFRERIDTYQARLLNIVFGVNVQNTGLSKLTDINSSLLHNRLFLVDKENDCKNKLFFSSQRPSLLQRSGYTYLLTRDQQKEQDISGNKKVNILFWYGYLQRQVQSSKKNKFVLSLHKEIPFLQKLGYPSLLKDRQRLGAKPVDKWNYGTVKAFANFKCENAGRVQQNDVSELPLSGMNLNNRVIPIVQSRASVARDTKQNTSPPRSFGSESVSKWHINGAKEILLYTGGGAIESLLKRFNSSLFCQFLLGELQILRKYYKDQIPVGYNRDETMYKHSSLCARMELSYQGSILAHKEDVAGNKPFHSVEKEDLSRVSSLSSRNIVTDYTKDSKARDLASKSLLTDKNPKFFCRRIYRTTRRLKIVQLLMRNKRRPEWMMISVLPVLPPDLRPVLQMGDNLIVASDLNTLYQRVIYRNNRHYKGRFLDFHFVSSIHRLVQDAVDRLIENGKGGSTPFMTPGGRPLKSLSDILKGKRGRFRFNLLGKRVDFSGRSVIVVDPNLKIHECGLPKEMALELYKYLLIRQLVLQKRVSSIVNAKRLIKERSTLIWDLLRQIIYYHPLLLNRAPTLHRLGIQAFQPKLTLGSAILLHPLVCAGFNADFDGDQMGVHLPLSPQARAEAWDLLWSRNNLLSPATGQPILLPSQDMVLGFYYMTRLLPYGATKRAPAVFVEKTELLQKEQSTFTLSSSKNERIRTNLSSLLANSSFLHKSSISTKNELLSEPRSVVLNKRYTDQVNRVVAHVFSDKSQVVYAYQKKDIDIHTPIWLKWVGKSENGEKDQVPLEIRISAFGDQTKIYPTYQSKNRVYKDVRDSLLSFYMRTTVGRVLVNNLISTNN